VNELVGDVGWDRRLVQPITRKLRISGHGGVGLHHERVRPVAPLLPAGTAFVQCHPGIFPNPGPNEQNVAPERLVLLPRQPTLTV